MTVISPARARLALLALALGGFGIGLTEFVAMGLLPNIAADLLPSLYAVSHEKANAQAGWLVSAYALGVVVGAPTIAAVAARFPRKQVLLVCVGLFTVGTVGSALLPTFGLVLAARFLAALPHGAYFGIAALVAASLMGPGKRGRGIALVLSGLTIANVIGVPAITFLGQQTGWRVAYLAVAVVFALTAVAIWLVVPLQPGDPAATMRRDLTVNPALNSTTAQSPSMRQVYRLVVNFGALPNATTKSVAHGLTITSGYSLTRLYAASTKNDQSSFLPIPYASPTLNQNILLNMDATNVNITTAIDYSAYTITYVIIEIIKQ